MATVQDVFPSFILQGWCQHLKSVGELGSDGGPPGGVDRVVEVTLAAGIADGAGLAKVGQRAGLGGSNGGTCGGGVLGVKVTKGKSVKEGSLVGEEAGSLDRDGGAIGVGDELDLGVVGGVGGELVLGELLGEGGGGGGHEGEGVGLRKENELIEMGLGVLFWLPLNFQNNMTLDFLGFHFTP